ncbi:hypothetical protein Angca_000736 [Angiostrongylus cantonensis]|nr:hypothetical protein Angca_000736 [Angiostrongylus cantonensis]
MTSLLGGNSILHIANRLGGLKKEMPNEGLDPEGTPSPTPSVVVRQVTPLSETIAFSEIAVTESPLPSLSMPPLPPRNDESNVVMSLFKDKETFTTSPSTSESATSGGGGDTTTLVSTPMDFNAAISHIQQQINIAQSQHVQNDSKDLLPGYSPWMRNAGRKKSHPVWEFFKDLKDTNGVGGVICLHCSWQGDDRSPNNLRTHLKKFHSSDGVFARFSEKLAQLTSRRKLLRKLEGPVDCSIVSHGSSGSSWLTRLQLTRSLQVLLSLTVFVHTRSMDVSPSTSSMADEIIAADVLSSLLNPCESPSDVKKKHQKSTKACKKSSEIWDHYRLLNENQNVECVYCWKVLKRGDSSTKSMWGHMTAFHQDVLDDKQSRKKLRVMAVEPLERKKFSAGDGDTPTQPYVKRARAGGNSQAAPPTDSVALAFQQLQSASQSFFVFQLSNPFNFLENLPKSSEVINISAGYPVEDEEQENVHEEIQAGSSGGSLAGDAASPLHEDPATSGGSPSVTSTNHLSAFMNMATNPLMWNAMLGACDAVVGGAIATYTWNRSPLPWPTKPSILSGSANWANTSTHGSAFSLNDGQCVSMLMKMALDLDLTLSYHKRRGDIELCFESNRTAEKSGGRGKVLCLSDMGREIRVIERVNGTPTDTEMWTKTDFNQFHWAIRGKCQKVLVKG